MTKAPWAEVDPGYLSVTVSRFLSGAVPVRVRAGNALKGSAGLDDGQAVMKAEASEKTGLKSSGVSYCWGKAFPG